jgi:uncharacterized protein (DUF58 family)
MDKSELLKKVRQIEIRTQKAVDEILSGNYRSVFKGRGIEFDSVKEYTFDDDIKDIDWNVTARNDKAYIKTYIEERELNVIITVDTSASQNFGTKRIKKDIGLEVAGLLSFSALKNQDKVGLMLFSDDIELFIPPKNSKTHVLRILREIATEREPGKGTNLNLAMEYLTRVLKRRSIIFFLSDFITDEDYRRPIKIIGKKHDFIGVKIYDPIEREMPDVGMIRIIDNETGEELIFDSSDSKAMRKYSQTNTREDEITRRLFSSFNIDFIRLSTNDDYLLTLVKFFKLRQKRR